VVETGADGEVRLAALSAHFPQVEFISLGRTWPDRLPPRLDVLIAPVDATSEAEVEAASQRLKLGPPPLVMVALEKADLATTRRLLRAGAADVLPAPVGETALSVSLERLFSLEAKSGAERGGEIIAFLKAGGGVGATALAVQSAIMLARRKGGGVCLADLDVQFGAAALYLDASDALTVTDCLSVGQALEETPFATALARHGSGLHILAAPRELTPLEALAPAQMDSLLKGLKRDFALTILELPSDWTAWTNRALQQTDRIVLVTQLTVAHVRLLKRQLQVLAQQGLEDRQLLVVCNALTAEQQASLPIKTAEHAIGRPFDLVLPDDRRLMYAAINQGMELASVRKGAKLEKALQALAGRLAADVLQPAQRLQKR
jgi:pilus assembly protein CpaE